MDLRFVQFATEELMDDVQRMPDVELADLVAAVFGTWSFIISIIFILLTGNMLGLLSGMIPSQLIALAAGINLYQEHVGREGWEAMNVICLLAGLWMMMASTVLPGHIFMQFSNTFAAMWIGLASAYASFLRQNDPRRETVVKIRLPM